jgi:hypothetical protein
MSLDELKHISLAMRALHAQVGEVAARFPDDRAIRLLTGDDDGPVAYDLVSIWRAALADKTSEDLIGTRKYWSPRRFLNQPKHADLMPEYTSDGRILVDYRTAIDFVQRVDGRVLHATIDEFMARRKAASVIDPIGAAVQACRGGGFGLMFARENAKEAGWVDDRKFTEAVWARAHEEAADLDDIAAESFIDRVRKAIEACPRIVDLPGASDG